VLPGLDAQAEVGKQHAAKVAHRAVLEGKKGRGHAE